MADPQPDHPAPDTRRYNLRTFLLSEWPYLLVLILALFGVAYTSFARTALTTYWVVLAPVIGIITIIISSHAPTAKITPRNQNGPGK